MATREEITKIIEAGAQAPSGDNMQPWKFEVAGNIISLFNEPGRDESLYNTGEVASMVALGAVVENIVIAARALGKDTNVVLLPDPHNEDHGADIAIMDGASGKSGYLFSEIGERCTNRKKYEKKALSTEQKHALTHLAGDVKDICVKISDTPKEKDLLARLLSMNEKFLFSKKRMHHFFVEYIRWTEEEFDAKKDGLYIRTLELSLPERFFLKFFLRYWQIVRLLKYFGTFSVVARITSGRYRASAGIGVIIAKGNTRRDFLMAGRAFECVWLEATRAGLSLQPLTGMSFLYQRVIKGDEVFTKQEQEEIKNTFVEVSNIFHVADSEHVVLAFRVGKGKPPTSRSLKREPKVVFRK